MRGGVPLPFALIHNRRSVINVWNLASAVERCLDADVAGRILHVSDPESLSTAALVNHIAAALGRRSMLWPCPPHLLRMALRIVGGRRIGQRLLDSLEVDTTASCKALGWQPPVSTADGIRRAIVTSA